MFHFRRPPAEVRAAATGHGRFSAFFPSALSHVKYNTSRQATSRLTTISAFDSRGRRLSQLPPGQPAQMDVLLPASL